MSHRDWSQKGRDVFCVNPFHVAQETERGFPHGFSPEVLTQKRKTRQSFGRRFLSQKPWSGHSQSPKDTEIERGFIP